MRPRGQKLVCRFEKFIVLFCTLHCMSQRAIFNRELNSETVATRGTADWGSSFFLLLALGFQVPDCKIPGRSGIRPMGVHRDPGFLVRSFQVETAGLSERKRERERANKLAGRSEVCELSVVRRGRGRGRQQRNGDCLNSHHGRPPLALCLFSQLGVGPSCEPSQCRFKTGDAATQLTKQIDNDLILLQTSTDLEFWYTLT